jgi:hypothetical protein
MLFLTPFYYFDLMDLARPSLCGAAAIGLAVATRWRVRSARWFLASIAMVMALHAYVILRVQWDEEWISMYILGIFALIDYGLILAFVKLIEVICRPSEGTEESGRNIVK